MTDEQVVRVLAEREGWKLEYARTWSYGRVFNVYRDGKFEGQWTMEGAHRGGLPNYLTSRDALQPVLEKLAEEEWRCLDRDLATRFAFGRKAYMKAILTIASHTLAHTIAEAIEGVAVATTADEKGSK